MPLQQISFEFDGSPDGNNPKPEKEKAASKEAAEAALPKEIGRPPAIIESTLATQVAEEETPRDTEPALPKSSRGRKSLKNIELTSQYIKVPSDAELFSKHYYSITEVAQMFQVNPSLLRFWESEFPVQLRLRKNKKGDRFFTPQDIKTVEKIWHLLRERKLTIEGARDFFKKNKKPDEKLEMVQSLQKLKQFLQEMRSSL